MKVAAIEVLQCDAGWRNYSFVKLTTESGGERHRTRVRLTKNRWESTLTAAAMRYDPITTELIPCDENGEDIVEKHQEEDDDVWGG